PVGRGPKTRKQSRLQEQRRGRAYGAGSRLCKARRGVTRSHAPRYKGAKVSINWAQCHTRPVLMIPGPTELPFPVIQAMNQPAAIQYDRSFDEEVLEPTTLALRQVFQTQSEVLLLPGS